LEALLVLWLQVFLEVVWKPSTMQIPDTLDTERVISIQDFVHIKVCMCVCLDYLYNLQSYNLLQALCRVIHLLREREDLESRLSCQLWQGWQDIALGSLVSWLVLSTMTHDM